MLSSFHIFTGSKPRSSPHWLCLAPASSLPAFCMASYFFWLPSIFPKFMKHQQPRPGAWPNPMVFGANYLFSRIWKHLNSTISQHLPSYYWNKKGLYRIVNWKCVILHLTQLIPRDLENTKVFRIRVEIHNWIVTFYHLDLWLVEDLYNY